MRSWQPKIKIPHYPYRFISLSVLILLAFAIIIWRMFDLTVINSRFLKNQGDARSLRVIDTPAYRGMIMDRHGEVLGVSSPVSSVWVNPQVFDYNHPKSKSMLTLLNVSKKHFKQKLAKFNEREFLYVKRRISPHLAEKIRAKDIPGVHFQKEFKRYYPEGESSAHILGMTNIDDKGQEGIELAFDKWLRGIPGKKRVLKDRLGHIVSEIATIREPRAGKDLTLSIDKRLQYLAYAALKKSVKQHRAVSGSAVILNAKTGEILAMVNQPSFNPNQSKHAHADKIRNRAVTDSFEPGSVIKPFAISAALENHKLSLASKIDTRPGWMVLSGHTIKDFRNYGVLTIPEILMRSSNIGISKIALEVPGQQLRQQLVDVGFGQPTGIVFPGEVSGTVTNHRKWNPFVQATLSFGYGLSVTTLQLAQAYSVFANTGLLMPASLIKDGNEKTARQIISPKVAKQCLALLTQVVESPKGTGKRARVKGYRVAGKTGTARKVGPHGYLKDHHVATFVGIAPANKPELVIAIHINDPRAGKYYGGIVAAPVFSQMMGDALRILNIPPNKSTI